jgi:hypothetical protein
MIQNRSQNAGVNAKQEPSNAVCKCQMFRYQTMKTKSLSYSSRYTTLKVINKESKKCVTLSTQQTYYLSLSLNSSALVAMSVVATPSDDPIGALGTLSDRHHDSLAEVADTELCAVG